MSTKHSEQARGYRSPHAGISPSREGIRLCGCVADPDGIAGIERHPACRVHGDRPDGGDEDYICQTCHGLGLVWRGTLPDGQCTVGPCGACEARAAARARSQEARAAWVADPTPARSDSSVPKIGHAWRNRAMLEAQGLLDFESENR